MEIFQILVNTLVRGAELSLLAIGLTMVFDILKFANFAHPDYAILGAFLAFFFSHTVELHLVLSVALAAIATGYVAVLVDRAVFKRLRQIGARSVTLMIASMGTGIAVRNLIRFVWTSHTKSYNLPISRPFEILGAKITPLQVGIISTAIISMIAFHLLLHRTTLGKALRAISDNVELASACAIDSEKMIRWMWILATGYAVIGGSLIAMEHLLYARLGFDLIIPVFCAAILGGIGNPYGAMLGALTLALAENVVLFVDFGPIFSLGGLFEVGSIEVSTGYKPAISFVILILVLLFRPTGIMGKR